MSGPIEDILSQFPGPITLRSSSSRRMMAGAVFGVMSAVALIYVGIMGRGLSTGHPQPDIAAAIFTGGRDVWLLDRYGFELEDLAKLLAGWHSRAIKE
jgi:hypothetical protein